MSAWTSLAGNLTVEITSAAPEDFLCAISLAGIELRQIEKYSDLTILISVSRSSYPVILRVAEKQGANVKVIRRSGLYWIHQSSFRHPVLLCGLAFLLLLCLLLPTRVFFVRIQGNTNIPTRKILSAAQDCGIGFGTSRRSVRSEKVKNALLSSLPELEWVGVNTAGCVAEISVRERADTVKPEQKHSVSHIVAAQDGYILSMTVTEGNPLCSPGHQVREGEILVSGYTDCGIFIRASNAEAEIFAQTNRSLKAVTPSVVQIRSQEKSRKKKYSLLIGKKRINLWKDSGILDSTCGRMYKEKCATLPGGFRLPLALCVEEYSIYDTQPVTLEADQSEEALSDFARQYLTQQMRAGIILSSEETMTSGDGFLELAGVYTCQEMIGRVQQEQIGDEYG